MGAKQKELDVLPSIIPARAPVGEAGRDPITGETAPHDRNEKTAGQVEAMSAIGFSVEEIAVALDMRPGQVRMHYARELDTAPVKANMQVAKAFFDVAKSGKNWQASLSWLRSRAGWSDGVQDQPGGGISINIHL